MVLEVYWLIFWISGALCLGEARGIFAPMHVVAGTFCGASGALAASSLLAYVQHSLWLT